MIYRINTRGSEARSVDETSRAFRWIGQKQNYSPNCRCHSIQPDALDPNKVPQRLFHDAAGVGSGAMKEGVE